jgi:hypothetical protein
VPTYDAYPFVIRELGGEQRQVRLTGRALPYRPFTLAGGQRVVLTWLPGNPVATATVLGPTEEASQLQGEWKDKYLDSRGTGLTPPFELNGGAVITARDAIAAIDSIRRRGQLLEVTWLDALRYGFVTKLEQRWKTAHDVEWALEFAWTSQGDEIGPAVFAAEVGAGAVSDELKREMTALDEVGTPEFGLGDDVLASLQQVQQQIEDGIRSVEEQVKHATQQVTRPVQAARGIVATLAGIGDAAADMVAYVDGQVAGAMNGSTPLPDQSFSARLAAEQYRTELRSWALSVRRVTTNGRIALLKQLRAELLGTHLAKAGEDLRDVSKAFYGTPFEWRRLLVFNELAGPELAAGEVVLIPAVTAIEASQQAPGV